MTAAHEDQTYEVKAKVLVVDDEPFNLEIMQEILSSEYDISFANSGPECLESLKVSLPDVILLDINMPGMSGYDVCEEIKKKSATRDIPVTFVSALDTLAERLAGYDVGGDDYITKPFEAKELLKRVHIAIQYRKEKENLRRNADWALTKANTVLSTNNELGIIFQFLRTSFVCGDIEKLASVTGQTLGSLGIQGSVQIRAGDTVVHKSSDGVVIPLEEIVVKKIHSEDAFIDLGNQAIINYEHVSILIKNQLMDNPVKFERMRDNIMLLAEGVDSRVSALLMANELTQKKDLLVNVADAARNALYSINDKYDIYNSQNKNILSIYFESVKAALASLTLTESQLNTVQDVINKVNNVTAELDRREVQVEAHLVTVMNDIEKILDTCHAEGQARQN